MVDMFFDYYIFLEKVKDLPRFFTFLLLFSNYSRTLDFKMSQFATHNKFIWIYCKFERDYRAKHNNLASSKSILFHYKLRNTFSKNGRLLRQSMICSVSTLSNV